MDEVFKLIFRKTLLPSLVQNIVEIETFEVQHLQYTNIQMQIP